MQKRISAYAAGIVLLQLAFTLGASAEIKRTPYPVVKVNISQPYEPDAAFEKMRKSFIEAARNKNAAALFALVAPGFVWTVNGGLSNDFDTAREPLHNFKVLFGFKKYRSDADGSIEGGPYWDALVAFAEDGTYYKAKQGNGSVCSPLAAVVQKEDDLEAARKKIDTPDEVAEWYFTVTGTPVSKTPGDKSAPADTLKDQAVPILSAFPTVSEGQTASPPTHYEVLLPSGKTGWIPAGAARPLNTSLLCYAPTTKGDWVIALYDGVEEEGQ